MSKMRSFAAAALLLLGVHAAAQETGAVSLLQAWQAAEHNDPALASARAALAAGQTRRRQADALWRPQIAASVGTGWGDARSSIEGAQFSAPGFGQSSGVDFHTATEGRVDRYTLSLRQPLVDGARSAQARQLELGADAAELGWQQARQELVLRVAEHYFALALASESLRLVDDQQATVARALDEVRERFRLGSVPSTDVHEAQARLEAVRAQRLASEMEVQLKQAAFANLTGLASRPTQLAQALVLPSSEQLGPLERWLDQSRSRNPLLQAQEKQSAVALQEVGKHRAAAAPTLDLVAQLERQHADGSGRYGPSAQAQRSQSIGVQLTIPLYTGGMRSARYEESLQLSEKARADGALLRQQIEQQVRAAWLGVNTGMQRVAALEQGRTASRARRDATRLGQAVGDRTTQQLLDAENEAAAAELAALQARVAVVLDWMKLLASAGVLNEEALEHAQHARKPEPEPMPKQ